MSYLEALLVAEARAKGRAQRSAMVRHRHLTKTPFGMLFWQLGAEPFTAAAVAWGFGPGRRDVVVAGEPRDRDLAFRALGKVARAFNSWFEGDGQRNEPPQIVLPNRGNLRLLGRLGRRLAYLSARDGREPDPELVRFGKHLGFLAERARFPGQQLVMVATDLLSSHWVSGLSDLEVQNLAALDAMIDPPRGVIADVAAAKAERLEVGPLPGAEDDDAVEKLMEAFDLRRGRDANGRRTTAEHVVTPLLPPIQAHYERLVDRGWPLLWRCIERERAFPEAPSVARRWQDDVEALERHLEWIVVKSGRYRTRATNRQAAFRMADWEKAQSQLEAEEIVDDPLRMIPCLLRHEALTGRVSKVDLEHREIVTKTKQRKPRIWVETDDECLMPEGKEVYWTRAAAATSWLVEEVKPSSRGGSVVRLKRGSARTSESCPAVAPRVGEEVVFSVHTTKAEGYVAPMQMNPPWTHAKGATGTDASIEEGDGGSWE